MDNMKRVIVVTSLISGCPSVFRLKPISFHYDEIERETTYTTRDLYLIKRNVPPYTLKLSVSKSCSGNFVDCEPDYYELVFYSSSYPGSTGPIGSEFDMSGPNVATTMLAEG